MSDDESGDDSSVCQRSDHLLARAATQGDLDAFEVLWSRHDGQLRAVSRLLSPAPGTAADAVTEVRTGLALRMRGGWNPDGPFRLIAYRALAQALGLPGASHGQATSITERAYDALPPGDQELLWYRDVEQVGFRALARWCGTGAPQVFWEIDTARAHFRALWLTAKIEQLESSPCAHQLTCLLRGELRVRTRHELGCTMCRLVHEEAPRLHTFIGPVLLHSTFGPAAAHLLTSEHVAVQT